jgi:ATP-dependent RNA helicase RhlE
VPTRELVIQVTDQARQLAGGSPLRITPIYGGHRMKTQIDALKRGVDMVIATPGRLLDHMQRRNIRFQDVKIVVLDEADRMLDMGFLPDIKDIIRVMPHERQTMLFSATMPPPILSLARQFQQDPVKIELNISRPPDTIQQSLYPVPKHLKIHLLMALFKQIEVESALVFTATKQEADIITRHLNEAQFKTACIHSDFQQKEREQALEGFRSGQYRILVATNIASRGLDIEGISHVINYDVPEHPEEYIHRIGRTARAEALGAAISLVTQDDEGMIHRIEYLLDRKLERKLLPDFNYDVPVPSWAKPSAESIARNVTQSQSLSDRWRSMTRGRR